MFRKIITYFLIVAVVLPVLASAVPLPTGGKIAGVNRAQAADATKFTSSNGVVYDPCNFDDGVVSKVAQVAGDAGAVITGGLSGKAAGVAVGGGNVGECISYSIVNFLYDWVLWTTIQIAGLAGTLFNASIQFSLTGKVFDANENTMIKDGWTLVRDLLNLVFIFILLFAAISTILQYGGFEIKKVLPSLIVVALLVNFSMMIAKMVIDASHIFAWEFYNQIDVKNEKKLGDGKIFANMKNDIEVKVAIYGDFEKKNLANVFIAGFNPQELLTGKEAKEGEEDSSANKSQWKQVIEKKIDEGKSISDVWWQMGLIVILESVLALFAGFILFAGAIMFIVRVVVLWLVMIFSPIAFLGMILPSMQKYSGMWWNYLIGQSFFAPAFLFMFMLVTIFINSKFIESIFSASSQSDSFIVLGLNGGTIALTFFHFFVVGGMMMACLIVARQLGGKTAEFGISWAHKGKGWALGGANKLVAKPLLRHTVGKVSSDMAKSGWAERMAAKSPTFGGWMKGVLGKGGDVGGFDKIMEQRIKTGQGLSTPALRAQYLKNLNAREQAEWYSKASARTRVELEDAATAGGAGYTSALSNMRSFYGKLSLEEQEKTTKARAEVDLKKSDVALADVFFARSEEIQKEILDQMKTERKPEFINKLYSRHGATLTSAATTPLAGTGGGAGHPVAQYTSAGRATRKFRPDLLSLADIEIEVGKHKPDDVKNLDPVIATNSNVIDAMIKQYNGGHVQKLIEKGDALTEEFINKLTAGSGGNAQAVSYRLKHNPNIQNHALANWIDTNKTARDMLGLS